MNHAVSSRPINRRTLVGGSLASAISLAASTGLAGCSGSGSVDPAGSSPVDRDHTVTIAMNAGSEPAAGFDPLVAWGCGEHVHEPLIQSTLVTTNDQMEIVGDLATNYYCSEDGLVWTFELRDDVKFTDGEPLTAQDVAFTINSVAQGDTSEADLSMVDTAVATDDHVLEVRLNKPYNALLFTLAVLGIVPEHAYGEDYGSAPIGSGRYMLEQWDKGQQVIFTANPDYYGDKPNMERVVVVFMAEDAAFAAAKSGQVDIAFTYPTYSDQTIDGFELANYKTVDSRGISLPTLAAGATKVLEGDIAYNAGNDVTCDIAIRRAINCGIDRSSMVEHVLNGYGHVAYSVGDGMPWSSDDMVVDYNLDRAKQLLDEAGWSAGSDGIRERDGVRAAFDVWYSSDDSARQALANEFCNQVLELGIEATPRGGMRSTCISLNHPCCGAGAPMRRLRCTSCTIPRAGATIPATRARWSTLILTRRWLKPPLRNPIRFGRRPCGMVKRVWPRRAPRPGAGSPTWTICIGNAAAWMWRSKSRTPTATVGLW